ncbi:MAG: glycosyltransferase, partial [Proteobacteria bacterium]|nr:glycosyltransferase [Pseudomonadota bacterium]
MAVSRPPSRTARARNRGALKASGEFLAFIDADVVVHDDTLARMVAAFGANPGVAGVFGCYDDSPDDSGFISQYKNLAHRYVHQDSHGEVPTFWSGCGAIRRSVFIEFGGFDEERYPRPAIEDIELGTW